MTQSEYIIKHAEIERRIQELKHHNTTLVEQEEERHRNAIDEARNLHSSNLRKIKASYNEQRAILNDEMLACKLERAKTKAEEEAAAVQA